MINLTRDWPILFIIIGVVWFFIFVIIKSKNEEKNSESDKFKK